jgi:hypothetical protein
MEAGVWFMLCTVRDGKHLQVQGSGFDAVPAIVTYSGRESMQVAGYKVTPMYMCFVTYG